MNEHWLKQNWFKVGLILAILILAYSIYGGGPSAGSDRSSADSIKLSMQCKVDGEKKLQEDKDTATRLKYERDVVDCFYMEPEYLYNDKLNTCLYYGGYTCDLTKKYPEGSGFFAGEYAKRWTRHIYDVYTNKSLADVSVLDSSDVSEWTQGMISDFWEKSKELGFSS